MCRSDSLSQEEQEEEEGRSDVAADESPDAAKRQPVLKSLMRGDDDAEFDDEVIL